MATVPHFAKPSAIELDGDGQYTLPPDHRLPGWTVQVLLAEGKVEEARAELSRLLNEGDPDEPGVEATPEFYQGILAEIRRRAEARR